MTQSTPEGRRESGAGPGGGPADLRWWQRVVPLTAIGALALVAALTQLPGLADEVEVSTDRRPQPFVELVLDTPVRAVCAGDDVTVAFRLTSHLGRRRTLAYTVRVDPVARSAGSRTTGRLRIAPGREKSRAVRVDAPAGPFSVTVRIARRPELLRVHCRGGAR